MPHEAQSQALVNYQKILDLLDLQEGEDPVGEVGKLLQIADGIYEALQPIGSCHRRSPSTLVTNVVNMKENAKRDRLFADSYRFLREPKACAPLTLPVEQRFVVSLAKGEALQGEQLDQAIQDSLRRKGYTYDPNDGPLQCYQVGESDWVAAQSPAQAVAVMVHYSGDWLHENTDGYEAELASDSRLDEIWYEEDDPKVRAGTLREWLAEAREPSYLNGIE